MPHSPSGRVFVYMVRKEHIKAAQGPRSMPFPGSDSSKDTEAGCSKAEGPSCVRFYEAAPGEP